MFQCDARFSSLIMFLLGKLEAIFEEKNTNFSQIVLIRSCVYQCSNLTSSYFSYTKESDVMCYPDGRSPFSCIADWLFSVEIASPIADRAK